MPQTQNFLNQFSFAFEVGELGNAVCMWGRKKEKVEENNSQLITECNKQENKVLNLQLINRKIIIDRQLHHTEIDAN